METEVTLAQALRSFAFWGSVLANGVRKPDDPMSKEILKSLVAAREKALNDG